MSMTGLKPRLGQTIVEKLGPALTASGIPFAPTGSFRQVETTEFDPASVLLSIVSTHSQFLPKEAYSFYKRDLFRRFSAHPASGFLKHSGRNWPNPGCSFYLPVSTCRNDPVVHVVHVVHVVPVSHHLRLRFVPLSDTAARAPIRAALTRVCMHARECVLCVCVCVRAMYAYMCICTCTC